MEKERLLVFVSGKVDEDGFITETLLRDAKEHWDQYGIVGIVSDQEHGGVAEHLNYLNQTEKGFDVPFFSLNLTGNGNGNGRILEETSESAIFEMTSATFAILIGWRQRVIGLRPEETFTLDFYDREKYKGVPTRKVHRMIFDAFKGNKIKQSAVTMSFLQGPVFYRQPFFLHSSISNEDDLLLEAKEIALVTLTEMVRGVLTGETLWDGKNMQSLHGAVLHKYKERRMR